MSEWYYGQGGRQEGPIDEATMRSRIAAGQVGPADLVWREGMAEWLPLGQVAELASASVEASPYATPGTNPVAASQQYYAPALPTSGLAIAALVCGILAILATCMSVGIIFGIPAVICGHLAMKSFKNPQPQVGGKGMALAGLICGYIAIVIQIVSIIFVVFIFTAAAASESSRSELFDAIDESHQESIESFEESSD
ncbi:GYF domain-containing protein [Akkermansiaceae bacterium]|nr:GYF domain-containing protein [Akkermansiaceae bacterium]MDB4276848.1 GYF domain-containing protein [bacterium]MDA7650963.1 GYF domain-containing protein [Akkermansiaceae bacterium]MDA7672497.1 GYF domain-containing protein [Akkermansiaceae bacterium]MDB4259080.1 GYF domain-containing protein [Akkermansiaceae bacterium]